MARVLRAGSQILKAGGAAFSPLSLPDLALWLDATKITGVSNGASLATWNDSSGLGRNAGSGVNATYRTNVQNGLPVVRYAAGYHTIAASTALFNALHYSGGTILAVVSFGTTADPNTFYGLLGNNAGTTLAVGYSAGWDDRGSLPRNNAIFNGVFRGAIGSPVSANISANNALSPQTAAIIVDRADPQNSTAATRSLLYVNGGTAIANNTETNAASSANATYNMQIGAQGNNVGPLTGYVGEVIICNAKLSVANTNTVGAYLATKWGLTWAAIS